jgi:hypothetical protein
MSTLRRLIVLLAISSAAAVDARGGDVGLIERFDGYADQQSFEKDWQVFAVPTDSGAGTALLDPTADCVILTAKQKDEGKTFTLVQLLARRFKCEPLASPLAMSIVVDQTEAVNWSAVPIAPVRLGYSGERGLMLWAQVGVHFNNDRAGTLVARVVEVVDGKESVLAEANRPAFGSLDGKPIRLTTRDQTLTLDIAGQPVLDTPAVVSQSMRSALKGVSMRPFVQQHRVFAPQARSSVLRSISITPAAADTPGTTTQETTRATARETPPSATRPTVTEATP